MTINHLQAYFCLWLGTKISFLIYSLFVPNWSQSRKNIFQCYATLWILIFMEQNTLLHSSQLSIAVINIILYYNDYCPAYTDTVGWLSVATNTMTHRLRTSPTAFTWQVTKWSEIHSFKLHPSHHHTNYMQLLQSHLSHHLSQMPHAICWWNRQEAQG